MRSDQDDQHKKTPFAKENEERNTRELFQNRKKTKWYDRAGTFSIVLVALILGGAVYYTIQDDLNIGDLGNQNESIDLSQNRDELPNYDVLNPVPVRDSQNPSPGSSEQSGTTTQSAKEFQMPVDGVVTKTHSPDTPVYSKTLDQYVVHIGIDIDTTPNTAVKSIAEGTVIKVYQDDKYGSSVWVSHTGGLVSKYSNLTQEKRVGEGDVVKQGDVIGFTGNTSLMESQDISHLHFSMEQDGKPVDPLKYLNK